MLINNFNIFSDKPSPRRSGKKLSITINNVIATSGIHTGQSTTFQVMSKIFEVFKTTRMMSISINPKLTSLLFIIAALF
jgi:hypothetical protein